MICAEGYLFEFERRGYVQAGTFVPEIVLEEPALVAGDRCNTNAYGPDEAARCAVRAMFEEQCPRAVDAGVDFVIGETVSYAEEALLALEVIRGPAAEGPQPHLRARAVSVPDAA